MQREFGVREAVLFPAEFGVRLNPNPKGLAPFAYPKVYLKGYMGSGYP